MSEKRFTTKNIVCSNYCVWDNNDKPYGNDEVVDLLNEQQDTISALKEENEQLKKENEKLRNIHLSIDLTYSYGYGRYLADVRVIDDE